MKWEASLHFAFPLKSFALLLGRKAFFGKKENRTAGPRCSGPLLPSCMALFAGGSIHKEWKQRKVIFSLVEHSVQNIKELFLSTEINRVSTLVIQVCQSCGQDPSTPGTFAVSGWDPQFFTPRPLVVLLLIALHLPPISLRSWKAVYEA